MRSPLRLLILLWLTLAAPAFASEVLRRVPPALDPAKSYVLVEIRNHDGLARRGSIVLARYEVGDAVLDEIEELRTEEERMDRLFGLAAASAPIGVRARE